MRCAGVHAIDKINSFYTLYLVIQGVTMTIDAFICALQNTQQPQSEGVCWKQQKHLTRL